MFESDNRKSLLDLLRPPDGYRLDCAFGTTYSLDFTTLTGAMLAFVDAEAGSGGPRCLEETLHAIVRMSRRVRVFVNRGYIHHQSRDTSDAVGLYDRIVREVSFDRASFHPKVWVLRYRPKVQSAGGGEDPRLTRVLCASRNTTMGQAWEIVAGFEGSEGNANTRLGRQISGFVETVLGEAGGDDRRLFKNLVASLPRAQFDLSGKSIEECKFLWQWPGGTKLLDRVPRRGQRALVISPFLGDGFIRELSRRFPQLVLVSTQRELDDLGEEVFSAFDECLRFTVDPDLSDEDSVSMDLHAKLYIFESDTGRSLLLGSANASYRAWEARNCEALMSLSPGISIQEFLRQFVYRKGDELNGWISEYTRHEDTRDADEAENDRVRKMIDEAHTALSSLRVHATYDATAGRLTVTAEMSGASLEPLQRELDFYLAPLSRCSTTNENSEDGMRPLSEALTVGAMFDGVSHADLSEFIAIRILHRNGSARKAFVIKASTDFSSVLDVRDTELLKRLLSNRKSQFSDFLRMILFDGVARSYSQMSASRHKGKGRASHGYHPYFSSLSVSVEDVLRACTADPSRVEEVTDLIRVFHDTDFVDADLKTFWREFTAAYQSLSGKPKNV